MHVNQNCDEGPAQLSSGPQLDMHLVPLPPTVPSNAPPRQQIQHPFSTMIPPPALTPRDPPIQQADGFGPPMFPGQDHSLNMADLPHFPGWHPGYDLPMMDLDLLAVELEQIYPPTY